MSRTAALDLTCEPLLGTGDLVELDRALAAAGLPTDDLAAPGRRFFRFRDASGGTVGYAGLESLGDGAALLRSLVVADPARRGRGLGRRIAEMTLARADGETWLLTTDAAPFFARLGFAPAPREAAPDALRGTRQFSGLCPASAVLMRRPALAS